MKLTLDEKACLKHKMTLVEVLAALAVRQSDDYEGMLENLYNREILVQKAGKTMVTQHWSEVMDEIICDSSKEITFNDEDLLELAGKMQDCYPQGKMAGTAFYYRCNKPEIVRKLKKFFLQYGHYTDDEIVDATKRFVASYRGNYKYLPLIKYFISKNKTITDEDGTKHITEVSELASYLENKGDEAVVSTFSDLYTKMI